MQVEIQYIFAKCKYFAERIIRHHKIMNIVLIVLIKPFTFTATTKRFCLLEISATEYYIESFLCEHELNNLVKEKSCLKNMQNPSCIDLVQANNSYVFQ